MFSGALKQIRRSVTKTVIAGTIVVGTLEVTTHLPSQGRSSALFHYVSDEWVTPTMRRLFDPETAHSIAIFFAKQGIIPTYRPSSAAQRVNMSQTLFNKTFAHPIGLAAGFDKDGEVIEPMLNLGFAFTEIGTVTPAPQQGNPKPRMFRLYEDEGIINRYGFNSKGAQVVKKNLEMYRHPPSVEQTAFQKIWYFLYPKPSSKGLVGVNIGKNKTSENAVADYVSSIELLGPYADYLVINVSSPNTPNLRDLQRAESLESLLAACLKARDKLPEKVPLLVKLAPDLTDEELGQVAGVIRKMGADGIVVTNTTNQRPNDLISHHKMELGGLSGKPVKDRSTECIRKLFALTNGEVPIVGVGGIGSGHDAYEKLKAGASLVQVYSMLVYKGPGVVSRIRKELAELMLQNGHRSIEDVIGSDHEEIHWRQMQDRLRRQRRKTKVMDA